MKVLKRNAIKAYKVFNPDWTCRDFQYEVGKSYHHKGNIKICHEGFHACEMAVDCFQYYHFSPQLKVAEVLCWGQVEKAAYDSKICCSNIQLVKQFSWEEVLSLCNTGHNNTGYGNSGVANSGFFNTGNFNAGNHNTGCYNTGNFNSGDSNSGRYNTGGFNCGFYNTGLQNTGNRNVGNCNSGSFNTGGFNSGNNNVGNWNSGNCNQGIFNTKTPRTVYCFNKPAKRQQLLNCAFPDFLFFSLTEVIPAAQMTKKEKKNHPGYKTVGGYLYLKKYKDAFRQSFFQAKKESNWKKQLKLLKALPNFDYKIFEEISGISKEELEA